MSNSAIRTRAHAIRTIDRGNAYLGILAALAREDEARAIADSLNPPVAATRCGYTYQTHYMGDVRVVYITRKHVLATTYTSSST